jgi:hypothetical protein
VVASKVAAIAPVNNGALLPWSTNFTGYALQTNRSLTEASGWATLTTNYSVLATEYAVTNAPTGAGLFYRLKR